VPDPSGTPPVDTELTGATSDGSVGVDGGRYLASIAQHSEAQFPAVELKPRDPPEENVIERRLRRRLLRRAPGTR
jgi:hypothetical protein